MLIDAVLASVAPASMLRLDTEDERELDEAKHDSRIDGLLKPLFEVIIVAIQLDFLF